MAEESEKDKRLLRQPLWGRGPALTLTGWLSWSTLPNNAFKLQFPSAEINTDDHLSHGTGGRLRWEDKYLRDQHIETCFGMCPQLGKSGWETVGPRLGEGTCVV